MSLYKQNTNFTQSFNRQINSSHFLLASTPIEFSEWNGINVEDFVKDQEEKKLRKQKVYMPQRKKIYLMESGKKRAVGGNGKIVPPGSPLIGVMIYGPERARKEKKNKKKKKKKKKKKRKKKKKKKKKIKKQKK